jgi:hypothetical protein
LLESIAIRVIVGGVLGFACGVAILASRSFVRGDTFDAYYLLPWRDILELARTFGIVTGAFYYTLASMTLLKKEDLVKATIIAWLAAFVCGSIAYLIAGLNFIVFGTSVGFWSVCTAIYRRQHSVEKAAGFGSYFR